MKNRYKINHLLRSIISNFLLEYVVFPMKYMIFGSSSARAPVARRHASAAEGRALGGCSAAELPHHVGDHLVMLP